MLTSTIKDTSIVVGIAASIIGGGIHLGSQAKTIEYTSQAVVEVKKEVKENQKINVEQTISLEKQAVILNQVASTLQKVEMKLDK